MHRGGAKCASFFREKKDSELCITDARGILQDGVEYRLQLVRRPRDDTEYVAGRSVPLQRLSKELSRFGKLATLPVELLL